MSGLCCAICDMKFTHTGGLIAHSIIHKYVPTKLSSVVWQLAEIDEDNKEVAWCLIKGRDVCTKPIRCGGINGRNYSTTIVKKHFEKYHPNELANAEKKMQVQG